MVVNDRLRRITAKALPRPLEAPVIATRNGCPAATATARVFADGKIRKARSLSVA